MPEPVQGVAGDQARGDELQLRGIFKTDLVRRVDRHDGVRVVPEQTLDNHERSSIQPFRQRVRSVTVHPDSRLVPQQDDRSSRPPVSRYRFGTRGLHQSDGRLSRLSRLLQGTRRETPSHPRAHHELHDRDAAQQRRAHEPDGRRSGHHNTETSPVPGPTFRSVGPHAAVRVREVVPGRADHVPSERDRDASLRCNNREYSDPSRVLGCIGPVEVREEIVATVEDIRDLDRCERVDEAGQNVGEDRVLPRRIGVHRLLGQSLRRFDERDHGGHDGDRVQELRGSGRVRVDTRRPPHDIQRHVLHRRPGVQLVEEEGDRRRGHGRLHRSSLQVQERHMFHGVERDKRVDLLASEKGHGHYEGVQKFVLRRTSRDLLSQEALAVQGQIRRDHLEIGGGRYSKEVALRFRG